MPPTISVALCTFNGDRFIVEQLNSIIAGGRLPDQVVISDDGSTDSTLDLVHQWMPRAEARGIQVRLLTDGPRVGVTANFAHAIEATTGDIVVLCDQDDRWHHNRLDHVAQVFADSPGLLLEHGDADLVDEAGSPLGNTLFQNLRVSAVERASINGQDALGAYLRRNLATGATVAFRRELFAAAVPLPAQWVHDEWLAIVAAATGRVAVNEDRLIDYRQHGSNQIGVKEPTLVYRITRMLATAPDRNAVLATRSEILATRLAGQPGVSAKDRARASAKARFERARAELPALRIARLRGILTLLVRGDYRRYASQGQLDALRDVAKVAYRPGAVDGAADTAS